MKSALPITIVETALIGVGVGMTVFWIQRWLISRGIVRRGQLGAPIFAVAVVVARQIWFMDVSWWFYVPFTILAAIVGTNRGDLSTTGNRGRWWWKKEDKASIRGPGSRDSQGQ